LLLIFFRIIVQILLDSMKICIFLHIFDDISSKP